LPDNQHVAGLQLAVRGALAAGLSVGLARALHLQSPLHALISSVLVTDLDPRRTPRLGIPRLAGTVLGATLGAVLSPYLGSGALAIGVGAFAAMFLCHLFRLDEAARVGGYVCGIVLLNYGSAPWAYAADRVVETSLGIVVAIVVSFVPKLLSTNASTGES
jgi:uncharacterized membrane protein YgaE (UPF0421/DUF939 family)